MDTVVAQCMRLSSHQNTTSSGSGELAHWKFRWFDAGETVRRGLHHSVPPSGGLQERMDSRECMGEWGHRKDDNEAEEDCAACSVHAPLKNCSKRDSGRFSCMHASVWMWRCQFNMHAESVVHVATPCQMYRITKLCSCNAQTRSLRSPILAFSGQNKACAGNRCTTQAHGVSGSSMPARHLDPRQVAVDGHHGLALMHALLEAAQEAVQCGVPL